MDQKKFKEELKEKILGFEVTRYLLESGQTRTEEQKLKMVDDAYKRLEKWILENIDGLKTEDVPDDSTISLDF